MIITPKDTIGRLHRLNLSNEQFSRVHHFEKTTVLSHLKYLKGLARGYQQNRNNYVVAQRLAEIEQLKKNGVSLNQAIQKAVKDFPLAER